MKLRTAIKVAKRTVAEDPQLTWCKYRRGTVLRAMRECRSRCNPCYHRRVPYIPSDDELEERAGIMLDIFAGLTFGGGIMGIEESILCPNVPQEEIDKGREQYFKARYGVEDP